MKTKNELLLDLAENLPGLSGWEDPDAVAYQEKINIDVVTAERDEYAKENNALRQQLAIADGILGEYRIEREYANGETARLNKRVAELEQGPTFRDKIAMAALPAVINVYPDSADRDVAGSAYFYADAMLAARQQKAGERWAKE